MTETKIDRLDVKDQQVMAMQCIQDYRQEGTGNLSAVHTDRQADRQAGKRVGKQAWRSEDRHEAMA
jgi:hypothetical protein